MELTKKSKEKLYNQFNGTGVIFFKTSDAEIRIIEFWLGKNGKFYTGSGELTERMYGLRGEIEEENITAFEKWREEK